MAASYVTVPKLFVITIQTRLLVFNERAAVVVDNVLLNKEHLPILFNVQIPSDDITTLSLLDRHIGMHTHAQSLMMSTQVQHNSMLPVQRPTCVMCQNDLDPGEPLCDECGADQKSGRVILKSTKHDDTCSIR